jgi:3-hydroxyisobutyrate dehydrogenase
MRIGFIGIGNMGAPMAANLVKGGHDLTVYDSDAARASQFAREHACRAAQSFADLADAQGIVTMLPTGQIVREVLLESEGGGLARKLRPDSLVIDMSSSDPVGTRQLGPLLAAIGIALIDAPVSGGVPRARSGTLAIMIGADRKDALERAKPVLACMGDRLFETGPLGSGHAMKALNNYVAAAGYAAAAEALLIGKRFGLAQGVMVDIINVSTGRNFNTEVVMKEHVLTGKYATGFALGLLAKDVRIAADLGRAMRLDAPLSRLISERYALASQRLGASHDNSEAILGWQDELAD